MQPPNTNNKRNIAIFVSRIKEEEYLVRKAQAVNIKKEKFIKYLYSYYQ